MQTILLMVEMFKEPDYDVVQVLYGFTLIALAIALATMLVGNVYALTGVLCMLLIKDGLPNFIVGAMKLGKPKEKKP